MADTTFSSGTVVTSEWLNAANAVVYAPIYAVLNGVPTKYATLQAAVTGIGSTVCDVVVQGNFTMTASATFPATATLRFEDSAQITTTGYTLTAKVKAGHIQCFTGTGTVVVLAGSDPIVPQWWGMSTAASAATNTTALSAAISAAAAIGNGTEVQIPQGSYALTAGTNFAATGVAIVGLGMPTLDFSAGTGIGFKLDAGGSGAGIQRMRVENIDVKGGPSITHAFYTRGIWRSIFKNCRCREATTAGFAVLFNVLNTWDHCYISDDVSSQTTRPTAYWLLDDDGTGGNRTQANTFINCEVSGHGSGSTSSGFVLEDATLNVWQGGTAESVSIGIEFKDDQCRNNSFYGIDLEDNQAKDVVLKGFGNAFYTTIGTSSGSGNTIDVTTAKNSLFVGGYMRLVTLDAGSSNTTFVGVHFEDNAALGIQGSGTYRALNITEGNGFAGSTVQHDVLGTNGTWTPVFTTGSGSQGAVTTRVATYQRVGSLVCIQAALTIAKGTLGAGALEISGLPFAPKNTSNAFQYITIGEWSNLAFGVGYTNLSIRLTPGSTTCSLIRSGDSVSSATVSLASFPDPIVLFFSGIYIAD